MPRRDDDYDYVRSPREVPRRTISVRDPRSERKTRRDRFPTEYETTSYVRDGHVVVVESSREPDYSRRDADVMSTVSGYGADAYYLPSRGSRDAYQSHRMSDRYSGRAETFSSDHGRRQRSPERKRHLSPDDFDDWRGDRGRRDERHLTPPRRLKSAMRGSRNESSDAARSSRARSVSFRDREVDKHDAGNQKHERPGLEARAVGQYLRHDDDDDLASETYAERRRSKR